MAEFCQQCSEELFGHDTRDLANMCHSGTSEELCEGCGWIYVNSEGKRLAWVEWNQDPRPMAQLMKMCHV
jgi:hypothetical protein